MSIRWKRSQEGFADSHCGHWSIHPLYCSCVKPQFFDLYRDGKKIRSMLATQRAAKLEAAQLLAKEKMAKEKQREEQIL